MIFFVSCSFFCLYGSCACCHRCYVPRLNNHCVDTILWVILFRTTRFSYPRIYQSSRATKSHPATRFYCPPQSKNGVFIGYPKSRYSQIFARFSPVKQSNMNRFWNGFHSQIALDKLYNIAAQSLSRHKLRCMKIIIETFPDDKWFACVSSVVFEAKSIWISRDVLARWTEQFDTTHDFLGRKLAKLENCILRSARDRFSKRLLFSNRYNKSIFCPISKRISLFGRSFSSLNSAILKFINFENS